MLSDIIQVTSYRYKHGSFPEISDPLRSSKYFGSSGIYSISIRSPWKCQFCWSAKAPHSKSREWDRLEQHSPPSSDISKYPPTIWCLPLFCTRDNWENSYHNSASRLQEREKNYKSLFDWELLQKNTHLRRLSLSSGKRESRITWNKHTLLLLFFHFQHTWLFC